jgi:ribosomal protein S18 acetylase RimI-like enzyme
MALAIPDAEKRRAVISEGLDGDHLIVATIGDELAGLAALCTRDDPYAGGSLSDESITWAMLRRHLGTLGAVRAALVLPAFGHKPQADELYLEDIAVAGAARGRGIGSKLLAEVEIIARELGKARVRLQVIDTNPRARALCQTGLRGRGHQPLRLPASPHRVWWCLHHGPVPRPRRERR